MVKRIDGPTPNGGAYATLTFLNDKRESASEEEATMAIGCEFDENDNLINETWITLNKMPKKEENEI